MPVAPGLSAEITLVVGPEDTALAFRSGEVAVLATPRLVALVEEAACLALADRLPAGQTTVGWRVQLDHVAPVGVGGGVRAQATLDKVEGRRLGFAVSVADAAGLVAAGRVTRVVVDVERFLDRAR